MKATLLIEGDTMQGKSVARSCVLPLALAALALLAIFRMPFAYYRILHLLAFLYAAIVVYEWRAVYARSVIFWLMVAVALMFNPVVPIHLRREVWIYVDLLAIGLFTLVAWRNYSNQPRM